MLLPQFQNQPHENQAEVTLIGAGAYGESIVFHAGNNKWVIIDSCVNPDQPDKPLSLEYLKNINVSFDQISLIVCSHWHNDHIRGISKILEEAQNADFCISRAHDKKKFLSFVGMDSGKPLNSSTKEFIRCLKILKSRNKVFTSALENTHIHKTEYGNLICLSPSDYTTQKFDHEIASLITDYGAPNKRIPYSSPNAKSIVLFSILGHHRAIFGADLEVTNNDNEGWLCVIKNKISIDKKSSLFKISHHGSVTGYHTDIWKRLLLNNPVATLTPWKLGNTNLPQDAMLRKYRDHTDLLFITETVLGNKQKKRDPKAEKLIKQFRPNLQEIKYKLGIIRSRIFMDDENAHWTVESLLGSKKVELSN